MTKLRKLLTALPEAEVRGSKEITLSGMSNFSKAVAPGHLFVAKAGTYDHGGRYIMEALRGGASAILTDLLDPSLKGVTQIVVKDVVGAEAKLAAAFYGDPSRELTVFGVTGTNGKSTVTTLIQQGWRLSRQQPCGLLGTIAYDLGREVVPATHTTPDAITVQKLMREMRSQGCTAVAMEMSSHALSQRRCERIALDVGVFTNLTQDHLDYHGTMEQYAAAKGQLFRQLSQAASPASPKHAVAYADDPWFETVVGSGNFQLTTFGWQPHHTLSAQHLHLNHCGARFELHSPEGIWEVSTPLLGRHNVLNLLAAAGALRASGIPLSTLVPHLPLLTAPSGRLEPVHNSLGLQVLVDYAHTPDALEQVCRTLKELTRGRLIVVFGAGGNRDRSKRPKMAAAVQMAADLVILTSDNPRYEEPMAICEDVRAGFSVGFAYEVIVDRVEAISHAIRLATAEDIVLIAGRGHETAQQVGHEIVPLQDGVVAAMACQQRAEAGRDACLTMAHRP
jgi:UDP-N-acetylmuramoyl-L-alanyl-D-glutamate--2,6-diaminopimelate ligase